MCDLIDDFMIEKVLELEMNFLSGIDSIDLIDWNNSWGMMIWITQRIELAKIDWFERETHREW